MTACWVYLNGIVVRHSFCRQTVLYRFNCYQMGNSLEQLRVCIGMFNSNTFICCRKCTFKMCFLNIPLNLANILAFCNISCKLISTYMKECLFNTHFMLFLVLLLLQSGDVEVNPGPASSDHGSLSIIHSNIRSVRNKLDYIKEQFLDFNIICLTETHLDISVPQ